MNLQAPEILIILAVVLLLFGAKKVPELARSVGQAQREFKKGANDAAAAPAAPAPAPAPAPAAPVDAAESTAA